MRVFSERELGRKPLKPMKETQEKRGLNRRDFMKISAVALTGGMLGQTPGLGGLVFGQPLPAGQFDREVVSCCQFCQVRCTIKVQVKGNRVINVYGHPENSWTGGGMCPKGKSMVELTYSPHRLLHPMVRRGEKWEQIPYTQALDLITEKMNKVKAEFPEEYEHRVALFAPLWESRESELAAEAAMNMAGFSDICSPGDGCIGNSATTLSICLGSAVSPTTLDEILNAEVAVLFGANIAEIYPPYVRWLMAAREKGVRVIYLDPRRTPTSNFCDIHLRPKPGTDGALVLGLLQHLIANNLYDQEYVAAKVNGFDMVTEAVRPYTVEKVAEITGLATESILDLAQVWGRSKRVLVWMGASLSRYTNSMQTVQAIIALQAITNNLVGQGKGLMNVQGGKPGGDEEFSKKYRLPDLPHSLSFRKILANMERNYVRVVLLNSSFRRYPDSDRVRKALETVDFVVYRGFFMTEEAKVSHLIMPGTLTYESDGSQYGAQRQVVWRQQAVAAPGETVPDWRFYVDLGHRVCGETYPAVNSAAEIYELMRETSPSWKGMGLERVKATASGVIWPCAKLEGPDGRGSLYPEGKFLTSSGKVELNIKALGPLAWSEPKGSPSGKEGAGSEFPLVFSQGKVVQHWQHTFTEWSGLMAQFSEGNLVQVHPETAARLNLSDLDPAWLETELGRIRVRTKVTEDVLPDMIWTPSYPDPASPFAGNQGQSINSIIPGYWDKVSAQFNGFGCRLTKITG